MDIIKEKNTSLAPLASLLHAEKYQEPGMQTSLTKNPKSGIPKLMNPSPGKTKKNEETKIPV